MAFSRRRPPPSPAATAGYSARKMAETEKAETIAVAGIQAARDILVEMLSACKANPIIGVVTALVILDILHSLKVITPGTWATATTATVAAFGISVALDVADTGVSFISAITGGGATAPDPAELIKPVPTTLVEAPNAPPPQSSGASGGLLKKAMDAGVPAHVM